MKNLTYDNINNSKKVLVHVYIDPGQGSICNIFKVSKPKDNNHANKNVVIKWRNILA